MKNIKLIRHFFLWWGIAVAVMINFVPSHAQSSNVPALVLAQGLNDTTIQLTWMAVAGADSYKIYRSGSFLTSQPSTLFNDSSLAPATTRSYQVSAIVGGAESQRTTAVSATTQAQHDASPPTQPGTITVSSITSSTATLRWGSSSDNAQVLGYRILRGAAGAPLSQLIQIATTEETATYTATNLKANTSYEFAVLALDASNNLSSARIVTFTTSSVSDTAPPAAPSSSSVTAKVFSSSRVDLTWAGSTSSDVSGYQIFRDGAFIGEVDLPLRRYFSDNGLTPSSSHSYQIQAIDSAGNVSVLTTARNVTTTVTGVVKIVRGPYIQWTGANYTRIAWWTNVPAPSVVNYGVGSLSAQVSDPVVTLQHVMLIGGLNPATSYQYQVVSNNATSATLTFSTVSLPGATFTFAAVGDYGGGSSQETSIANKIAASGAQFVQTLGDNVYPDGQDPDFATTYSDFDARFYKPYTTSMGKQTLWLAGGNHEYYGDEAFWRNIWMPNNERWYSYDWGDAHFLVLDTELSFAPGSPQYQFAQADLSANQSKNWRIVVIHRPPYSSVSNNSSSTVVRNNLVPLFEQQHVQLVLTGHSHNYERTYPLIGGVPQTAGGVTYIVSGGGGNGLNSFTISQPSWSAFRQASYEYMRIAVSPNSIQLDAINDSGAIFDSTTISSSGANATNTPTLSASPTNTATVTNTPTPSRTPTVTRTPTSTATAGAPGTLTFTAGADARVVQASPTTNYGTATTLQVDGDTGAAQTSYIRFITSGISGSIQSVKLRVFCTTNGTANGPAVYLADNNWIESGTGGITWNTQPALLSGVAGNTGAFGTSVWVEYDVTSLVTGNGTFTFALLADSTDGVTFSSREGTTPPQLVVTLGTGAPTPTRTPTATATNPPVATNTPTSTPTTGAPVNTPTSTATPTTGSGNTQTFNTIADARVVQASPTTNYGTSTNIQADGDTGAAQTSFIRFNVSGISGTIQNVKLRVYCTTNGTANGPASYLADSNWVESGTGGITWDTQPALLSGASDNKVAIPTDSWVEYDVTALVSANGTYTFALVADGNDGVTFSSREGTNAPQLVVTFGP